MSSKLDKIIKFYYSIYEVDVNDIAISKKFFNNCFSIKLKLEPKRKRDHIHSSRERTFIDLIDVNKIANKLAYFGKDIKDKETRQKVFEFCHFLKSEACESYTFVINGTIKVRKYREDGKIKTEQPIFLLNNCLYSKNFIKTIFELPPLSVPELQKEIKTMYGLEISLSELYNLKAKYEDDNLFLNDKYWRTSINGKISINEAYFDEYDTLNIEEDD